MDLRALSIVLALASVASAQESTEAPDPYGPIAAVWKAGVEQGTLEKMPLKQYFQMKRGKDTTLWSLECSPGKDILKAEFMEISARGVWKGQRSWTHKNGKLIRLVMAKGDFLNGGEPTLTVKLVPKGNTLVLEKGDKDAAKAEPLKIKHPLVAFEVGLLVLPYAFEAIPTEGLTLNMIGEDLLPPIKATAQVVDGVKQVSYRLVGQPKEEALVVHLSKAEPRTITKIKFPGSTVITAISRKDGDLLFDAAIKRAAERKANGETGDDEDAPKDAPKSKERDAKTAKTKSTLDVSHVKVGQKYHWKPHIIDNAAMKLSNTSVWEVVEITAKEIKVELSTTTKITMKNPNIPPQPERVTKSPLSFPIHVVAGDAGHDAKAPKPVGEERIVVSGIAFECKIYDNHGVKAWTCDKFPFSIKSMMRGKVVQELERIE